MARFDYPGVSCQTCREAERVDGAEPDCRRGKCLIPAVDGDGRRILGLHNLLQQLDGLVDSRTVLEFADADLNDLILLAEVNTLLRSAKDMTHG